MPTEDQTQEARFQQMLADALAMQDRLVGEPLLNTTGKSHLASRGVEGLKADALELAARFPPPPEDGK
ncbi:MAG TPA: hypothetical protein VGE39_09595 [Prosthecobacter sp.]